MASYEEWCADKSLKLAQENLRIDTLNEIKEYFTSVPHAEALRTANMLELPLVFDCLNDSNKEQVDLACEVLTLCMNNLSLGDSTNRYDVLLDRALNHPYPNVKLMALKEIERSISKEETIVELCKKISMLNNIIRCIGDNDIEVGKKAVDILTVFGVSNMGMNMLISDGILDVLKDVMSMNEVVKLRVYEMLMNISKESEQNFLSLELTGIISNILDELDNNDILLRMNVVEILTQLGLSRHGYLYLEENGILGKLFALIDDNEDELSIQLCEPGILKFFGNMAHLKPVELLSKYPKFFDRLFTNIESGDLTIVGVTLDTLGIIGISNEGKCALQSTGNKISYAIKTIVKLLTSLPNEVRIRALNCLENLLRVTEPKPEINQITRRWYNLFNEDPMEIILRYAKNPFQEMKIAGLSILHALAEQQWGQEEIKNTPGLIEYLLDRNVEVIKECKELKYAVIKALTNSTTFDHLTLKRLQEYVKEGPFYVQGVTEIAFEGNE